MAGGPLETLEFVFFSQNALSQNGLSQVSLERERVSNTVQNHPDGSQYIQNPKPSKSELFFASLSVSSFSILYQRRLQIGQGIRRGVGILIGIYTEIISLYIYRDIGIRIGEGIKIRV